MMLENDKPFQLNAADFKTSNFLVNGMIKDAIKALNSADLNKDGKSDVGQIAPFIFKAIPVIMELLPLIDWLLARKQLAENPAVKDPELVAAKLEELSSLAYQVSILEPTQMA